MTAVHHAIAAVFAFCVGASVGSFLNVCVWRLPRGESLIRPASRCPRCGSAISAHDNLPVLGWLLLRGRCRSCSGPISARYPLVEAGVGLLFAAVMLAETLSATLDRCDVCPWIFLGRLAFHGALVSLLVTTALIDHDRRQARLPSTGASAMAVASALAVTFVAASTILAGDQFGFVLTLALLAVLIRRTVAPRLIEG